MAGIKDISSVWKNIKEIDLKPIRDSATYPVRIVLVGAPNSGRHTLAEQMRTDPARPGVHSQSTIALISVDAAGEIPAAHLTIVIVDATRSDFSEEQALVKKWNEAGKNLLVFINKIDLVESRMVIEAQQGWMAQGVLSGSVNDIVYLQREFIPTVLGLLPQQHIALGRQFPLFRLPIARQLITETCFSNAAYSFSTGLAEIVPLLDIPLNLTDLVVLTKTQAFLAYKLGLLLGFSTRWQDYVTEFGSVVGSGFLWRQIARGLIGLIPAWGIIPKVAVAYSGTYVVGNAILGWYLTGRNLSPKQMRALYSQSFTRGKEYARMLLKRLPKRKEKIAKLPRASKKAELAAGEIVIDRKLNPQPELAGEEPGEPQETGIAVQDVPIPAEMENEGLIGAEKPARRFHLLPRKGKKVLRPENSQICPNCGKSSSADASFCQYCGNPF